MRAQTIAQVLASTIQARLNCEQSGNTDWFERHTDTIRQLEREVLPSGSGIDRGTTVDLSLSTGAKLVLYTSYHHMDENGMYAGWTEHRITVRPTFDGLDIQIGGRNRNEIKEYLTEVFSSVLEAEYTPIVEQAS